MSRSAFFLLAVFFSCIARAVPARPVPIIVAQADGTLLQLRLIGDETFHYYMTDDGVPVLQSDNGSYYYAVAREGKIVASDILARSKADRSDAEAAFVNSIKTPLLRAVADRRQEAYANAPRKIRKALGQDHLPYIGSKKGLVILVEFPDYKMSGDNPHDTFDQMFNEIGYSDNSHIGSVHDYFYDQSYGKFDLTFDVVGPVTVSRNLSYYGINDNATGRTDIRIGRMIAEACILADKYVDYKDYDWDGDGEVEQVFVVYAGYGEASGGAAYTIWPHEFSLTGCKSWYDGDGPLDVDGVTVDTYACSCELTGSSGNILSGIGTACHEFSHCLGLPDFYDVNYNGGFGMNAWDLMCSGSYNGPQHNGEIPCGYTAYERWYAGWLDYTELNAVERIMDMPAINDAPVAYVIYNDNNLDEYFLLENRQNRGWFSYANTSPNCHGMLVTHVNYDKYAWERNTVNTRPDKQRMSIVPADNSYGDYYDNGSKKGIIANDEELEGDLFPGRKNVREFTDISHINTGGMFFNAQTDGTFYLNKPITNIKEANGLISFDFMGGIFVPQPVVYDTSITGEHSFTISWHEDAQVDSFAIEAVEIRKKNPYESVMLSEDFSKIKDMAKDTDGENDLSLYLSLFMQNPGWKGRNVYCSKSGIKIGNAQQGGYIIMPYADAQTESVTVKAAIQTVGDVPACVTMALTDEQDDTIAMATVAVGAQRNIYHTFTAVPHGMCRLGISGEVPFYISSIALYDGAFVEKDFDFSSIIGGIAKPLDTHIVTGVTEHSYTFANLPATAYQCRVRAVKDDAYSEWTAYTIVDFEKTSIKPLWHQIESPRGVYDISGRQIGQPVQGVYIIDYGTHKKKVLKSRHTNIIRF